jgi:putative ABC transport system permease protein
MERILKFIKVSLSSLWENKTRSLLTMMGIIVGIGSVILMLSVGKGAEALILSSIESFGNRSIFVQPGGGSQGGPPSPTSIDKVKYRDYLAISKLDYVEDVTPVVATATTLTYLNTTQLVTLAGSNEHYQVSMQVDVERGRFLSFDDVVNSARVIVLGSKNAEYLFGDQDPIGKQVKIAGKSFLVVGVLKPQGTRFFTSFDDRPIMPITTMRQLIFGGDYVMSIVMNAKGNLEDTIEDLRFFIRKRHAIYNPEDDPNLDDFKVISQVDAAETFRQISDILTITLVAIAAISLLVGGIGIMNIMLVSVSERTREIGIRKAVGANNADVLVQFLTESAVLTFVAGLLGVVGGVSLSWLIAQVLVRYQPEWQFIVTADSVLLAFGVSVGIGILFGIYPARSASRLDTIECLRME